MDLVKFARPHHIATVAQSVIGVKDAKSGFVEVRSWIKLRHFMSLLKNTVNSYPEAKQHISKEI